MKAQSGQSVVTTTWSGTPGESACYTVSNGGAQFKSHCTNDRSVVKSYSKLNVHFPNGTVMYGWVTLEFEDKSSANFIVELVPFD